MDGGDGGTNRTSPFCSCCWLLVWHATKLLFTFLAALLHTGVGGEQWEGVGACRFPVTIPSVTNTFPSPYACFLYLYTTLPFPGTWPVNLVVTLFYSVLFCACGVALARPSTTGTQPYLLSRQTVVVGGVGDSGGRDSGQSDRRAGTVGRQMEKGGGVLCLSTCTPPPHALPATPTHPLL